MTAPHDAMNIRIDSDQLRGICQKRHIRKLSFFGSVLRDDFRDDSDVDLLVEFEPGHTPGWDIMDIEDELSELLGGRRIDIVNPRYLNHRVRDRILDSAVVRHEAPDVAYCRRADCARTYHPEDQ